MSEHPNVAVINRMTKAVFENDRDTLAPEGMTYIVQRKDRFYVVAHDGLDPLTGKE